MIRQANRYDKTQIINLIRDCYLEMQFETKVSLDNEQYWNQLLDQVFAGRGVIFIKDNVGLVFAMFNSTIWCPKTLVLHCLAWVVKPEYRNKTIAYRLLKTYTDYADKLKDEGRIQYYTLNKTTKTPNMNYQKLGFRKADEVWVR
jgi:N-acetylglutamate synthase-like GNAT family acetyltransferase